MLTLAGDVGPLPQFVGRIGNADLQRGETVGEHKLWPTARPSITIDRGERFTFALRIRHTAPGPSELQSSTKPTEQIDYKLRRETKEAGYWLDIAVGPFGEPGRRSATIELRASGDASPPVKVQLTVNVLGENVIATPGSLDVGELLLSRLRAEPMVFGRLGVRKLVGAFRIMAISSSLPFIKLEKQTIVEGSNYLIRLSSDPNLIPKPGSYRGILRIETDDTQKPLLEVPISVTVADR